MYMYMTCTQASTDSRHKHMHRYMLTHSCTQWNRHPCIILAITALHCLMCVLWRIHTCKLGHSAFYAPAFSIVSWQDHANFLSAFLRFFFFPFLFYLRKGSGFTFTFLRRHPWPKIFFAPFPEDFSPSKASCKWTYTRSLLLSWCCKSLSSYITQQQLAVGIHESVHVILPYFIV